jgi:hypothetical protein
VQEDGDPGGAQHPGTRASLDARLPHVHRHEPPADAGGLGQGLRVARVGEPVERSLDVQAELGERAEARVVRDGRRGLGRPGDGVRAGLVPEQAQDGGDGAPGALEDDGSVHGSGGEGGGSAKAKLQTLRLHLYHKL